MVNTNVGRREALKKIGLALAAASASGTLAMAQNKQEPMAMPARAATAQSFKIPATARLVKPGNANGRYDVFVAHNGANYSISLVNSNDAASSKAVSQALGGASPAKASVTGGIIHVGVGGAASRGSVASMGSISFRGAALSNVALIAQ
jgi:hypothetical protein